LKAYLSNLGKLITAHSVGNGEADSGDEDDLNKSKDEEESALEGKPPAKKKKPDEPRKDKNPLITINLARGAPLMGSCIA